MKFLQWLKRFILKQRIEMLRADIVMVEDRRREALITVASTEAWSSAAYKRLRILKGHLSQLESPDVLLAEALRHGE
jgi:hypothetical protein